MSVNQFYEAHRDAWDRDRADVARQSVHASWFRTDTADYWRHARMYEPARAFLHLPDLKWLTIGDGRFGLDSIRLRRMGLSSVLPTDIGDGLLKPAKEEGLIGDYRIENAERLSFGDDSFDVVFCKESYHHFPRGPVALYEMLRVARHAVILVEPRDYVIDHGPVRAVGPRGLVADLIRWCASRMKIRPRLVVTEHRYLTGDAPQYEDSGNYLYAVSSRELEKTALGLNLPAVAFKGLNDCYIEGGETEPADESSTLFKSMRVAIETADRETSGGRGSTSLLMAMLFKELPDQKTCRFLSDNHWSYRELQRNPYVTTGASKV